MTSTRIGHAFLTYVTPRVVLSAELVDQAGQVVAGSRRENHRARGDPRPLARGVRHAPQARAERDPHVSDEGPAPGMRARVAVVVEPDAFYVGFFETLLRQGAGRASRTSDKPSRRHAARPSPSSSARSR